MATRHFSGIEVIGSPFALPTIAVISSVKKHVPDDLSGVMIVSPAVSVWLENVA